ALPGDDVRCAARLPRGLPDDAHAVPGDRSAAQPGTAPPPAPRVVAQRPAARSARRPGRPDRDARVLAARAQRHGPAPRQRAPGARDGLLPGPDAGGDRDDPRRAPGNGEELVSPRPPRPARGARGPRGVTT